MSHGELTALHHATGKPILVRWDRGLIRSIEPARTTPPGHLWIAPPLFDLQVNGYAGIDFQQDNLTTDDLLKAATGLRNSGCGRFLLTLITDHWPRLMARLQHLIHLRAASPILQRTIAGWHIEGPFLSAEPGFAGAHNPEAMCDPLPEHIHQLRQITGTDPVMLTLAPERPGAISVIPLATSLGIHVSLGHTDAPAKRIEQATKAGAVAFTHLGNGCPRDLNRHNNILWRMFESRDLMVGLIVDAIHVSAPLFRIIHRNIDPDRLYYTTDAMSGAGAPPGRYKIGRLEVEVGPDHIARQPGSELFAGSALSPITGIFRAAEMLKCPWTEVWPRYSDTPARIMKLPPGLQIGHPADFCLLHVTPESWFEGIEVYADGLLLDNDYGARPPTEPGAKRKRDPALDCR